jgi:hypothetical protein
MQATLENRPLPNRAVLLLVTALLTGPVGAQEAPSKTNFFLPKSATAAAYVLGRLSNAELIAAPRGEFVYVALLQRQGLERKYRVEALEGLAKLRNTDPTTELLAALAELDRKGEGAESVLRDLAPLLIQTRPETLAQKQPGLEKLATTAQRPLTRQLAHAGLITAAGHLEPVWQKAESDPARLADLVRAIEWLRAPASRSSRSSRRC